MPMYLLVITGLPGAGKSTLARALAAHLEIPVLGKDNIKELLFDVLGTRDAAWSRQLSDASFAVLFAMARELVSSGVSAIIEGNFRAGEHDSQICAITESTHGAFPGSPCKLAQILCRIPEPERQERLRQRAFDLMRHAAHRDSPQIQTYNPAVDSFLNLPGERFVFDGSIYAPEKREQLIGAVDKWRKSRL